jgi:hypothetical protein
MRGFFPEVKGSGRDTHNSLPPGAEVKNACSKTTNLPYVFKATCLITITFSLYVLLCSEQVGSGRNVGSNLDWDTDYAMIRILVVLQSPASKFRNCASNYATTTLFHIFIVNYSLIMLLFNAIKSELLTASINKPHVNK